MKYSAWNVHERKLINLWKFLMANNRML